MLVWNPRIALCCSLQPSAIFRKLICVSVPCRVIRICLAPTTYSCIRFDPTVLWLKLCFVCFPFTLPSIWQWSFRIKLQQSRSRGYHRCDRCRCQAKRPTASLFDTARPRHDSIPSRRVSCNSDDPPGRQHGESHEENRSCHSADKR